MAAGRLSRVLQHLRGTLADHDAAAWTDADLLTAYARRHEEAAFETLVRRHGSMVLGVCRRVLGNAHDAEDAFQATFLVLVRKASGLRSPAVLANWLYGVAHRTALEARRARAKRRAKEARVARPTQTPPDIWEDLRPILDQELERLPEKYRAVLVLCDLEGQSRKEAARQLGCPEGTVASRLARARMILAKRLARHGLAVSGGGLAAALGTEAAAVPRVVVSATLQAAARFAAGRAAAGVLSTEVAALTERVLKTMLLNKLRTVGLLVLGAFFIGGGALALCLHGLGAQAPSRPEEPSAARGRPGPRQALTDRHGDPLPQGALARLGTMRFRLGNGVYHMALAPDGKTAVSVGGNAWTQFWDVATGREIRRIDWKHGGGGRLTAYSPDGRLVATVQDHGPLHVWHAATGKHFAERGLKMDFASSLGFSPSGRTLAVGGSANIYGRTPETLSDSVISLWQWDGARLRALWESSPDHEAPIKGPRLQAIKSLAFSPDGKHLATGGLKNNLVRLWNVATGKEVRRVKASGTQVGGLAFAANGKLLASGSDDGTVALWDPATGTKLQTTKQPGEVRALAFSPDAKTLAVAGGPEYGWNKGKKNDPFLALLDPSNGKVIRRFDNIREGVAAVGISKDGRVLAAGLGGVIRVWQLPSGREVSIDAGHQHWISEVDISEDGRTALTAGGDGPVILWDLATGAEKLRLAGHQGEARSVTFLPGGKCIASAGTDQKVRIWDRATGRQLQEFEASPKGLVYALAVSPDGRLLAAGDYTDGTIHIWDLAKRQLLHRVKVGDQIGLGVLHLGFGPSGKVLAVGETALNAMKARGGEDMRARIQLWDVATGNRLRQIPAHQYCVNSLAFSPDGQSLASTGWSDKSIRLWDAQTGKELFAFPCDSPNGVVRFSPDGRVLACGNNRTEELFLWEVASMKLRRKFQGHIGAIHSLVFSQDGRTLVSGSMDTTALVWDVTGLKTNPPPAPSEARRLALWRALARSDAVAAGRAVWSLAADPKPSVEFLARRLREPSPQSPQIAKLVADLDSEVFKTREAAERKLQALGKRAVPALGQALSRGVSLEARRRVKRLWEKRAAPLRSPEALQVLRAIEVLEHAGTPAARQALDRFARKASGSYFGHEARAAAERLTKKFPE
jgi:RNA polymerase sigma factor (sigma-70 family)